MERGHTIAVPHPVAEEQTGSCTGVLVAVEMETERELCGRLEEEALGAGDQACVSAGPPLPRGYRSLANKRL